MGLIACATLVGVFTWLQSDGERGRVERRRLLLSCQWQHVK